MAKKIFFFFFSGSWLTKVPSSSLCILLVQALAPLHTITSKRDIPGYVHAITRLRWQGVNDLDWAKMKLSFASFPTEQCVSEPANDWESGCLREIVALLKVWEKSIPKLPEGVRSRGKNRVLKHKERKGLKELFSTPYP